MLIELALVVFLDYRLEMSTIFDLLSLLLVKLLLIQLLLLLMVLAVLVMLVLMVEVLIEVGGYRFTDAVAAPESYGLQVL
jgi:hypothetical protein